MQQRSNSAQIHTVKHTQFEQVELNMLDSTGWICVQASVKRANVCERVSMRECT